MNKLRKLQKKAGGQITLFHATSSQAFEKMVELGEIMPSGYTGVTSNGLFLPEDVEEQPSGDENAVYLANEEYALIPYYEKAIQKTHDDKNKPNIGITLEVYVDEDALAPDYDDLSIDMEKENPTTQEIKDELLVDDDSFFNPHWKQSLERINQVVHKGPISIDRVKSVQFDFNNFEAGNFLSGFDYDELMEIFEENDIRSKKPYSVDQAYNTLQSLYRVISAGEETKDVTSRLRKVQIKKG